MSSAVLLVALLTPAAMACVVPEAQLTPTEQACCKKMADDCGSMSDMGSKHSCCKPEVRPRKPFVPARGSTHQFAATELQVELAQAFLPTLGQTNQLPLKPLIRGPSPPGTLDNTIILRI